LRSRRTVLSVRLGPPMARSISVTRAREPRPLHASSHMRSRFSKGASGFWNGCLQHGTNQI